MGLPLVAGLFKGGLLAKGFNALFFGDLLNSLLGNPIGGFVDRLTGRQDITEDGKDNLGVNKRLLNLRRGESPTQGGALRFLGGDGRLDDSPDIVPTNQSVLNDIAKNQGLSLGTTIAPQLDTKKVMMEGFTGLVGIIDQINKNIGAIGNSLIETSAIEGSYRKKLMEDLEEDIAEKGKTRSRTRFEKSIFNFVTTRKKNVQKITGNLTQDLTNALLTSIGLELVGDPPLDGDDIGDLIEQTADNIIENYGDIPRIDFEGGLLPDSFTYGQEGEDEAAKNLENAGGNLGSFTGIGGPTPIEAFLNLFKFDKKIMKNVNTLEKMSDKPLVDNEFPFATQSLDIPFVSPVSNSVSTLPLDSMSGTTQIIDLRTAQEISGDDTAPSSATSQLDGQIVDLDPSRRISPYEGFQRSV